MIRAALTQLEACVREEVGRNDAPAIFVELLWGVVFQELLFCFLQVPLGDCGLLPRLLQPLYVQQPYATGLRANIRRRVVDLPESQLGPLLVQ